jgi:uncharacterized protein
MATGNTLLSELSDWESRFGGYWKSDKRPRQRGADGPMGGPHTDAPEAGPAPRPDGAHDIGHFRRVWMAAAEINREEGGHADDLILLAASYFHDIVSLPKNDPRRGESSLLSAEKAGQLLAEVFPDFPAEKIGGVQHAILAHSFSAGIAPETPEAKILQDADRLEAVGAIGVARVFYIAGQLGGQLFDADDPLAAGRELDDRRFALDHFAVKLLKLPAMMHTAAARRHAEKNAAWMRLFIQKLCSEIAGDYST